MADKDKDEAAQPGPTKDEADHRAKARAASLARDQAVVDAVFDATHDKAGNPIPLGVADELPQPPGIKVVAGKP